MTHEALKDYATVLQSIATVISFIIGGIWVYMKYIRQQEKYPHIEFFADINFVGKQQGFWIVELIASIENKGKVQHKINEFGFDLNALYCEDKIDVSQEWGGQVNFPHLVTKGSFLPKRFGFFFIDPAVKAKYSYVTRVPQEVSFLILHCWFQYADRRNYGHTAERSVSVPKYETGAVELEMHQPEAD